MKNPEQTRSQLHILSSPIDTVLAVTVSCERLLQVPLIFQVDIIVESLVASIYRASNRAERLSLLLRALLGGIVTVNRSSSESNRTHCR